MSSSSEKEDSKSDKRVVIKELVIEYGIRTYKFLKEPIPFWTAVLIFDVITSLGIFWAWQEIFKVSSESLLQILGSMAEVSASLLAIFLAVTVFLFEKPGILRKILSRKKFLFTFLHFSVAILICFIFMVPIEPNTRVAAPYFIVPAYFLTASLTSLLILVVEILRAR